MALKEMDIRQSETRILQDQLNSATVTGMDSTLASINNELTVPGRLIAQSTPSLIVSVGGDVVNPNTSKNRVFPLINNTAVTFAGGTITFPSTSGTITVNPGVNASITIGASQFVAVLVQLDSTGQLNLSVSTAAGSLGAVVVPGGISSFLSLGYIIVQSNGSSIIQSITNAMLYQFVGGGGSGSGGSGGNKNYLSAITTSNSSGVPNNGNGNFELGSTVGWSLAHSALSSFTPTSVAGAGTPFDSTHGGSAASGNLSLTTVSSNQLAGLYSGDLASSAASVAGDLLVSDAFYIDTEDQAKMMQIKFYYEDISGTMNFSGTTSNTFAVWIYDITNAAWIMPQGVYNLVQNSGTGYCTATFQTTSNSTRYQLALININATPGAYSIYLDDFSVGPQTAPTGPAMTDWIAYTPTGSWVSNTTYSGFWRRVGDSMELDISITLQGLPTAGALTVNLPSGYSIDISKAGETARWVFGKGYTSQAIQGNFEIAIQYSTTTAVSPIVIETNTGANPVYIGTATTLSNASQGNWANGNIIHFYAKVPIVGWSSNSSMSADTDTRVVAMQVSQALPTATITSSPSLLKFTSAPSSDTHGSFSISTGLYTVPVSGYYKCTIQATISASYTAGQTAISWLTLNGTPLYQGVQAASGTFTSNLYPYLSITVYCLAGSTLAPYVSSSGTTPTITSNIQGNFFTIERLSGPAVVTATESVNATYNNSSGQSFTTGTITLVTNWTKEFDSHDAFNATTGIFTAPVSGKYTISAQVTFPANTTGQRAIYLFKNGSEIRETDYIAVNAQHSIVLATQSISMLAGEILDIRAFQNSGGSLSIVNSSQTNFISIDRVGN